MIPKLKWYQANDSSFRILSAAYWSVKPTYSSRCGWILSVQAACQIGSEDVLKASSTVEPGWRIIWNWVFYTRSVISLKGNDMVFVAK